jgi:Amt family ammonium transporter
MAVGWLATAGLAHMPTAVPTATPLSAVNLVLAAAGGACGAGLYTWFVAGRLDVLMAGRGLVAGPAVMAAGAAFLPTWTAPAAGLVVGIALPPLLFLGEQRWRLGLAAAPLATLGLPAGVGLLLPGLLADGRSGAGWNRVGVESFLGVPGQGVSGAWVAAGLTGDWPGQLYAQLIGLAAIVVWSFALTWLALALPAAVIRAWQRSGPPASILPGHLPSPPAPLPQGEGSDSPSPTWERGSGGEGLHQRGSGGEGLHQRGSGGEGLHQRESGGEGSVGAVAVESHLARERGQGER